MLIASGSCPPLQPAAPTPLPCTHAGDDDGHANVVHLLLTAWYHLLKRALSSFDGLAVQLISTHYYLHSMYLIAPPPPLLGPS